MILALTAGQVSDHIGAKIVYPCLPGSRVLIADKGYDSNEWRAALSAKGITACIPPKANRKANTEFDKVLYKQRHKIENTLSKIKDWRRIATRYDRCADVFMAAVTLAVTCIFWLR